MIKLKDIILEINKNSLEYLEKSSKGFKIYKTIQPVVLLNQNLGII